MHNFHAFRIALVALTLCAPSLPVAAEPPGDEITEYTFEDTLVGGDLKRPDGEVLQVRRRRDRESLIRIREHFVAELLKSVERL